MRVALVVMPFAAVDRPNLAVGLLKAALRQEGIDCEVKYLNLTFWRLLGSAAWATMAGRLPMTALGGEWAFSQAFYGERFSTWESYEREVLEDPLWGVVKADRGAIRAARAAAPGFLRLALESCDWGRYDLVGFTSTFEQTLASLGLARLIRRRYPHVLLAVGGANFEAGMGRPYVEGFDFLDFVSTGEADVSFPALCRNLRAVKAGESRRLEVPPGFLHRRNGSRPAGRGPMVRLDRLPTPDFDDYFRAARRASRGRAPRAGEPGRPWLMLEASRGCWWGAKSHCTFCGLNGSTMRFRAKDWRRVVAESDELLARYGAMPLQFTDNILSMAYFDDLLPFWASRPGEGEKFFEIKANLRRRQVELLHAAGVRDVQPGIESFCDDTLRLMQKGASAAQNVALLRWCAELGIKPAWNVLFGFPGEPAAAYERNLRIMSQIPHLRPPKSCALIRLDRFSPNFADWRGRGFTAIEPLPAYRHVYPFDEAQLVELAYFFRYRQPGLDEAVRRGYALERRRREWWARYESGSQGELAAKPHWQGGYVLVDRRFDRPRRARRLSPRALALLLACDGPAGRRQALARAGAMLDGGDRRGAGRELRRLVAEGAVAEIGSKLITLALLPAPEQLSERPPPGLSAARRA